jgi:hypothetical protein
MKSTTLYLEHPPTRRTVEAWSLGLIALTLAQRAFLAAAPDRYRRCRGALVLGQRVLRGACMLVWVSGAPAGAGGPAARRQRPGIGAPPAAAAARTQTFLPPSPPARPPTHPIYAPAHPTHAPPAPPDDAQRVGRLLPALRRGAAGG